MRDPIFLVHKKPLAVLNLAGLQVQDVDANVLVLWWIVLLLGFAAYIRWYVPRVFRR
jgi:hypothetical protein